MGPIEAVETFLVSLFTLTLVNSTTFEHTLCFEVGTCAVGIVFLPSGSLNISEMQRELHIEYMRPQIIMGKWDTVKYY